MTPRDTILEIITRHRSFLVLSHENPDGDAIGAMAGLGFLFQALGKSFTLCNISGLPRRFAWLELPGPVQTSLPSPSDHWAFALDCGDSRRLGEGFEQNLDPTRIVNIDHHLGNPEFGAVNWVDPDRSSVGEMIGFLAQDLGVPLQGPLGEALYLAMVTDTGSFSYGNTRPETLCLAARIIEQGLDLDSFNARMLRQWTLDKVHLHGLAMQQATVHAQGRIGVIRASSEMLEKTGTLPEDCEGLVNYIRQVHGVVIAVSLREENGMVKFSLRSWGEVDVRAIASRFDGGGHKNAAGGSIKGSLDKAERLLVEDAMTHALEPQPSRTKAVHSA
jgi:phosphoesterase RecJ-like protein